MKRKKFTKIIYVKLNGIHYKPKFAFVSRQKTRLNGNFSIVNTLDGKNHWKTPWIINVWDAFFQIQLLSFIVINDLSVFSSAKDRKNICGNFSFAVLIYDEVKRRNKNAQLKMVLSGMLYLILHIVFLFSRYQFYHQRTTIMNSSK